MSDGPVCVTGASGFIGAHLAALLLARGCRVRGTVRSLRDPARYDFLTSLPGADDRLALFEASLQHEGSYDTAVAGCTAVMHGASPYVLHVEDPQRDLVDPAVQGTLNVLRSCARTESVARVVLTSSMAAISDEPVEGKVFTEADWNEHSTLARNPYYLSKVAAEKAAWAFVEEEQPGFDLVVINPYLVIGPSLCPSLNTSNAILRDLLAGGYPAIMNLSFGFVDVRDVAEAHLLAMENPAANGRYLCANKTLSLAEVADLLRREGYGSYRLPRLDMTSSLGDWLMKLAAYSQPQGTRSYLQTHIGKVMRYDNSKIKEDLGITFRPVEESILETVPDLIKWGHLPPQG